jgi:L-histidine Nalpha-methyltransferase
VKNRTPPEASLTFAVDPKNEALTVQISGEHYTLMTRFETVDHESEFWRALKARRVPVKFAYTGEAAYTLDRVAAQDGYKSVAGTTELEVSALETVTRPQSRASWPVCDVGPGNALHSNRFLQFMQNAGYKVGAYLGLDFSSSLLNIAIQRLSESFPEVTFAGSVWDFEASPTVAIANWRPRNESVLISLLGQTLGNPDDPVAVLRNLHASSLSDDILLIGVSLLGNQNDDEILSPYRNDIFRDAILRPLQMMGLDPSHGEFRLSFRREKAAVIGYFVFNTAATLERHGEHCKFEKGEKIECFFSRRFLSGELESMLAASRWNVHSSTYDRSRSHVVVASTCGQT